jgi:glucosamine--fructose-6-phosphate aminotransferase (isomerizing)
MCGIVACISEKGCVDVLYNGIMQLKNRGYDSTGICSIQNGQMIVDKYASTDNIDAYIKLKDQLYKHELSTIGIAHTRWATHGAKTDINSHPHLSMCGKFAVVHNGIIENYKSLKEMLICNGYVFKSQTDTEVIAHLLSLLYMKNANIAECIETLIETLEGTWGLAIICTDEPNILYCTRHGSPLLVGYDDNCAIIVSEKSGFCNKIPNYFVLTNYDICKIIKTEKGIEINTNKEYTIKQLTCVNYELTPHPYPYWTIKEINEQVESSLRAISMGGRLLNSNRVKLGGLEEHTNELKGIDNLILLGCGTSYFAGMHGLYFLKDLCDFHTVQLFDGAEFTEHDIPKQGKTALLLISQSGETKDLHRCIGIGKKNNLFLIGVVNVVDSLIAREVDCGCYLNAGREVAVASTKAYSSQVILLAMISVWFSQEKNINDQKRKSYIKDIRQLQCDIKLTLEMNNDTLDNLVENIFANDKKSCFLLGKGKSESVAREGSLKIKEISYIHSEGYSTSSLKHGPFALLDENFPVIIIAPNDEHYSKGENAYEEIKSRHSPIIFITNKKTGQEDKPNVLYIPENNKTFADLLCVIPLQLLAYKLALSKGINPDMPRNLAKVVTVE